MTPTARGETSPEAPMRADARRNRESIVAAAQQTFGELGVEAQMTDVARCAGLGMGTVYRHFPTKEDLVNGLLLDRLQQVKQAALAAAARRDPWAGLRQLLASMADATANLCLSQFMGGRITGSSELQEQRRAIYQILTDLVDAAKRSGELRLDVEATDLVVTAISVARAGLGASDVAQRAVRRHLEILLDGLRAPHRHSLADAALTRAELETLTDTFAPAPTAFRRGQRSY